MKVFSVNQTTLCRFFFYLYVNDFHPLNVSTLVESSEARYTRRYSAITFIKVQTGIRCIQSYKIPGGEHF